MYLATTADQRFWKKDEEILFLGEWCRVFDQRSTWSNLNHEILPYHWKSVERYYADFQYLDRLYESLLPSIADSLNTIHNEKHSVRYWRTIVSPWLYYFIQTLFDRYLSIRQAIDSGKATLTWIPSFDDMSLNVVPQDYSTFERWQVRDDYNLYLYSQLIRALGGISFAVQNDSLSLAQIPDQSSANLKDRIKQGIKRMLGVYSRLIPQGLSEIAMMSLYINSVNLIRLQIALGQLPCPYSPVVDTPKVAPDCELRKKLKIPNKGSEFEFLLSEFIPKQIPTVYLEGYSELKKGAKRVFPKNPKVILYVNAHHYNEGFKVWSAGQMEKGARLLGMIHGGHYGSALWSSNEIHETKIADKYYSWGWEVEGKDNVIPSASMQLSETRKRFRSDPQGKILWLGMSRPRYSCWMFSAPVGMHMLEYVEEQKKFFETLLPEALDFFKMRLFHADYKWGVKERLKETIPNLCFDTDGDTMYQQLCQSRLCIGTYNSTTNLETISANFPTIAFWNFDHWKLRESARPYFDDMVQAGVFHDNPESAAKKVNEVYEDPMTWWLSTEVQEVKNRFCHRFARTSPNWLSKWKNEINRIARE